MAIDATALAAFLQRVVLAKERDSSAAKRDGVAAGIGSASRRQIPDCNGQLCAARQSRDVQWQAKPLIPGAGIAEGSVRGLNGDGEGLGVSPELDSYVEIRVKTETALERNQKEGSAKLTRCSIPHVAGQAAAGEWNEELVFVILQDFLCRTRVSNSSSTLIRS